LRNSCLRVPRVHDFTSSFACLSRRFTESCRSFSGRRRPSLFR
jgi:hypothetical protein